MFLFTAMALACKYIQQSKIDRGGINTVGSVVITEMMLNADADSREPHAMRWCSQRNKYYCFHICESKFKSLK